MRVLVLDDDPARHRTFKRNLIGTEAVLVDTFAACVRALSNTPAFDVVYLDHDLNDHVAKSLAPADSMYGGVRELTGLDVAKFMASELDRAKHPKLVVVHSYNDSGAKNMISVLKGMPGVRIVKEPFHAASGKCELGELAER